MGKELRGAEALIKIKELIEELDVGMLTTKGEDGLPRSRPMSSNGDIGEDGTLWFFSRGSSLKVMQISTDPIVHVAFSNPSEHMYVSITGNAEVLVDKATIEAHWKPALKAWFPEGIEDPDIALIRLTPLIAEYWEAPGSLISHTLSFAKALVTGSEVDLGEHGIAQP